MKRIRSDNRKRIRISKHVAVTVLDVKQERVTLRIEKPDQMQIRRKQSAPGSPKPVTKDHW